MWSIMKLSWFINAATVICFHTCSHHIIKNYWLYMHSSIKEITRHIALSLIHFIVCDYDTLRVICFSAEIFPTRNLWESKWKICHRTRECRQNVRERVSKKSLSCNEKSYLTHKALKNKLYVWSLITFFWCVPAEKSLSSRWRIFYRML